MIPRTAIPLALLAASPIVLAADAAAQAILPAPTPVADTLAAQMRTLAASPRDMGALVAAAEASLRLGDGDAAAAFLARADAVDARDPRIGAVRAVGLVRAGRPGEALRLWAAAERAGVAMPGHLADRGLAHDLVGQGAAAQADYRRALATDPSDETVRRLALSLGIGGATDAALMLLDPLLRRQDRAAWRARAFVLAMGNRLGEAERIASGSIVGGAAMAPFFGRLAALGAADRAFAVHFGELTPSPMRLADARLAPGGAVAVAGVAPRTLPPVLPPPVTRAVAPPVASPPVAVVSAWRAEAAAVAPRAAPTPVVAGRMAMPQAQVAAERSAVAAPTHVVATAVPAPVAAGRTAMPQAVERLASPVASAAVSASVAVAGVPAPVGGASSGAALSAVGADVRVSTAVVPGPDAGPVSAPVAVVPVQGALPGAGGAAGVGTRTGVAQGGVPMGGSATRVASAVAGAGRAAPVAGSADGSVLGSAGAAPALRPRAAAVRPVRQRDALASVIGGIAVPEAELATPTPVSRRASERPGATRTARAEAAVARPAATKPTPAKLATAKPAKPAPEPRRWYVQVAGGANASHLGREWRRVTAASPKATRGKQAWVTPQGATNRLLAGPFASQDAAMAFVNAVKADGTASFAWQSAAGQAITRLPKE